MFDVIENNFFIEFISFLIVFYVFLYGSQCDDIYFRLPYLHVSYSA